MKKKIIKCDVCGRVLSSSDGGGVEFSVTDEGVLKDLPEIEKGRVYIVCFVCLLKAAGIKFKK